MLVYLLVIYYYLVHLEYFTYPPQNRKAIFLFLLFLKVEFESLLHKKIILKFLISNSQMKTSGEIIKTSERESFNIFFY